MGLGGEGRGWEGAFGGGAMGGAARGGPLEAGLAEGKEHVSFPRFFQRVLCGLGFAPGGGWKNGLVVVGQKDGKGGGYLLGYRRFV